MFFTMCYIFGMCKNSGVVQLRRGRSFSVKGKGRQICCKNPGTRSSRTGRRRYPGRTLRRFRSRRRRRTGRATCGRTCSTASRPLAATGPTTAWACCRRAPRVTGRRSLDGFRGTWPSRTTVLSPGRLLLPNWWTLTSRSSRYCAKEKRNHPTEITRERNTTNNGVCEKQSCTITWVEKSFSMGLT